MENHPVGAELLRMDRLTDRETYIHEKANSSFSKFSNVPKNTKIKIYATIIVPAEFTRVLNLTSHVKGIK
jgi:hypothetical protein